MLASRSLLSGFLFLCVTACAFADIPERYRGSYYDFDPDQVRGFEKGPDRDDIVPGEFIVDAPTLENLGFRWYIEGDSNRNAKVEVSYRKKGETRWREALPMFRSHHEIVTRSVFRGTPRHYRTANLFAGTVFFLDEGTEYEVRFDMSDPDGGAPAEPKIMSVATRARPQASPDGRTLHVYPPQRGGGQSPEGAYDGIMAAYEAARPGDVILIHSGFYAAGDAPYKLTKSGEEGKPIVFRGENLADTVIEGPDLKTDLFHLADVEHIVFENLQLRRAHTAITSAFDRTPGTTPYDKTGPGARWITVRRCQIQDVTNGVWTYSMNSVGWIVSDCVITGTDPFWFPRSSPDHPYMGGAHTGVNVYGQGHVVCYNRIARFSDSVAIANYGEPPADIRKAAVNIDFYNNDLSFAQDDTLETDYGCHNIRAYRNRCYNAATGLSVQPAYGGPIYLIRNVCYNLTLHMYKWNNQPSGIVAYHNVGTNGWSSPFWSNAHLRNNLAMGSFGTGTFTPMRTSMDYNGWMVGTVKWMHGTPDARDDDRHGRLVYESLADFSAATGFEKHGVIVDYSVFADLAPPKRGWTYVPEDFNFRLDPSGKAVDAGCRLPNINDDYRGAAPDLGALELGAPPPHYGPRVE